MDSARALLDRELLLSGVVHELRGPITALQGFHEIADRPNPALGSAVERLGGLVALLAEPLEGALREATFRGAAYRASGPPEVLEAAVADLPHGRVETRATPGHLEVTVHEVPATERLFGWSLADTRRWLAGGGPGAAGARLRIAARMVGAEDFRFTILPGEGVGTVTIRLPTG